MSGGTPALNSRKSLTPNTMKTLILLLLTCVPLCAATTYPLLTDNPARTFIGGGTNIAGLTNSQTFSGTNTFYWVGINTNDPKSAVHILSSDTNAVLQIVGWTNQIGNLIEARNSAGTLKFSVNPSGEVGIGAAPTRPLYILDNTQGGFRMERTTATARAWDFYVASDGSFNFYDGTAGGNRMGISTAGTVSFPVAVSVGGGTAVTAVLTATATLDYDLTIATFEDKTIDVTGAQSGDCVIVGATASAVGTSIAYFGWVNSANSVGVRAYRIGTPENPPSQTYRVTVIRH